MNGQKVKLPAIQMYPGDWQRDTGLRACSLEARGLWIEMLCLMHHAEPYGHLTLNGQPMDLRTLSRLVASDFKRTSRSFLELERNGVFSRNSQGVIYSRRMVKDEALRRIRRQVGHLGGNPKLLNLVNQKDNQEDNQRVNQGSNQTPTPSVAVAVPENSEQHKPLSRNTAVKHQTARESDDTASLAQESPHRETTAPASGPPDPLVEFRSWVHHRVPNWARSKAHKTWRDPDDEQALREIFGARALFEIQACWEIFITPGTKSYDHAVGQKFAMREFQRQIEYLVTDDKYPNLKRRYMNRTLAGAPG